MRAVASRGSSSMARDGSRVPCRARDGAGRPLAVPLTQPGEVAMVREGAVPSVAARDPSGGLEVLVVDGEGRLGRHVRRPPEPGVAAIVPHDGGFLVLPRDQM